jgi:hypothetical protein
VGDIFVMCRRRKLFGRISAFAGLDALDANDLPMTPRRWPFLLVAMLFAFPAGALADPVEITNSAEVEGGAGACSIWVEPAGEQYEWTFVCGAYTDEDGDGDIDSRSGGIWRDICQEDDL